MAACRGRSANCCAQTELPRISKSAEKKPKFLTRIAFCILDLWRGFHCIRIPLCKLCRANQPRSIPYLSESCGARKVALFNQFDQLTFEARPSPDGRDYRNVTLF